MQERRADVEVVAWGRGEGGGGQVQEMQPDAIACCDRTFNLCTIRSFPGRTGFGTSCEVISRNCST
eukprot:3568525-Rhodomonas_salina.2